MAIRGGNKNGVIFLRRKALIFRHPYWGKVIFKLIL